MLEYLKYSETKMLIEGDEIKINHLFDGRLLYEFTSCYSISCNKTGIINESNTNKFLKQLDDLHIENWADKYYEPVCDGVSWSLDYKEKGKDIRHITGGNAWPENFKQFKELMNSLEKKAKRM